MMFNSANASQESEETIFWKQVPYSKCTPFHLLEVPQPSLLPAHSPSLSCLFLIRLPHDMVGTFGLKSNLAHFSLCSIFCDAWIIGAQQMLFSKNGGKDRLISARS